MLDDAVTTVWNMQTVNPGVIEYTPERAAQLAARGAFFGSMPDQVTPIVDADGGPTVYQHVFTPALPYPDYDDPGDAPDPRDAPTVDSAYYPAADEDEDVEALALNEHPEDVRDEAGEPPRDDGEEDGAA